MNTKQLKEAQKLVDEIRWLIDLKSVLGSMEKRLQKNNPLVSVSFKWAQGLASTFSVDSDLDGLLDWLLANYTTKIEALKLRLLNEFQIEWED